MANRTAIVIVNWNCWEDTARCINACSSMLGFDGTVIVVDNNSTDESLKCLRDWAAGIRDVNPTSLNPDIAMLEDAPCDPLRFMGTGDEQALSGQIDQNGLGSRTWYLVSSSVNGGFGAGNNVGLRLAMRDNDYSLFWCLNADAIPETAAWRELVSVCGDLTMPFVGGSVLLNYNRPDTIQTVGSSFSRSTLVVSYQYVNEQVTRLSRLSARVTVDYPIGASLVLNRAYLERYGYFDERYFLYYEEPDLAVRLNDSKQCFVCTRSLVYHKGGQTTGGGSSVKDRGLHADYEFNRSRMILARKLGGRTVLLAILATVYSIARRIRCGRLDLAKRVVPACVDGWRCAR